MPQDRVYQEVFGIATGDIVTTSYGSGPLEVWSIAGPRYTGRFPGVLFVRTWPVISLTLIKPGTRPRLGLDCDFFWINDIREEEGRWFTDSGDEIVVTRPASRPAMAMDLFASLPPALEPYRFDPEVDYQAGQRQVWRCRSCERDFNAMPTTRYGPVPCPRCKRSYDIDELIVLQAPGRSEYTHYLSR